MKLKLSILTIIFSSILLTACHSNDKAMLKGSIIELDTAILFRTNFVSCPNQDYHIPVAYMFETSEFNALFQKMSGIDKIRIYPAINTHNDDDADSLTFIMVPVNASDNKDNLSEYLFEYAQLCPANCSAPGSFPAPTQQTLNLLIPTSWCISRDTIEKIIKEGEAKVGEGKVYGIRFYWYTNEDKIMDLELRPTADKGDYIADIDGLSYKGVTQVCIEKAGCCDTKSKLFLAK